MSETRPEILMLAQVPEVVHAQLQARYTLHARAEIADFEAWLAGNAARISGIVTSGGGGVPNALMDRLPNLKVIAVNGVGFDQIDLPRAKARGIRVSTTPDVLTDDVADLAIGLMIAVMRRIPFGHQHVQGGLWPKGEMVLTRKASGRRYGIVGLGRIGLGIARRLEGFGGSIGYSSRQKKDVPYTHYPDPLSLAQASEVLIVAAAATPETHHAVNRAVLEALGPDGVLVNIARGALVDEDALVDVLASGRLGAAGLDVFANEPHVPEGLYTLPNVLVTPHIGSATVETRTQMAQLVVDNLAAFYEGRPMPTPLI